MRQRGQRHRRELHVGLKCHQIQIAAKRVLRAVRGHSEAIECRHGGLREGQRSQVGSANRIAWIVWPCCELSNSQTGRAAGTFHSDGLDNGPNEPPARAAALSSNEHGHAHGHCRHGDPYASMRSSANTRRHQLHAHTCPPPSAATNDRRGHSPRATRPWGKWSFIKSFADLSR